MELAVLVVGVAVLALIAIVVAPSRRVRAERKLPTELETRVLLGESPREIDAAVEPRHEVSHEGLPPAAS